MEPKQPTEEELQFALDWCLMHGIMMRHVSPSIPTTPSHHESLISLPFHRGIHLPFAYYPSPFSKILFDRANLLQPIINTLVDKLSCDSEMIRNVIGPIAAIDSFAEKLFNIWEITHAKKKNVRFGILRSDYMAQQSSNGLALKQVEINTIAASFSSLGGLITQMQCSLHPNLENQLRSNESFVGVADALAKAHFLYRACAKESQVLMVIQPNERNSFDQRWIEVNLFKRRTFNEISAQGTRNENNCLMINDIEISVVYYRAGYGPEDYPSSNEWSARELLEHSKAICCPSAAYQLIGFKKYQQIISAPGLLEKYLTNHDAALVRSSFVNFYTFDGSEKGEETIRLIKENPTNFVLKPQREGGGHNVYGNDIPLFLDHLDKKEREYYIAMEMIKSPTCKNYLVREGHLTLADVVSELGIFGVYLCDHGNLLANESVGYLFRTKSKDANEGGVSGGFGVIDCPLLK